MDRANPSASAAVQKQAATHASAFGRIRRSRVDQIEFYTIGEIAEGLRVSTRTVRRWIGTGDLIAHRIGGVIRIAKNDLNTFLALNRE